MRPLADSTVIAIPTIPALSIHLASSRPVHQGITSSVKLFEPDSSTTSDSAIMPKHNAPLNK